MASPRALRPLHGRAYQMDSFSHQPQSDSASDPKSVLEVVVWAFGAFAVAASRGSHVQTRRLRTAFLWNRLLGTGAVESCTAYTWYNCWHTRGRCFDFARTAFAQPHSMPALARMVGAVERRTRAADRNTCQRGCSRRDTRKEASRQLLRRKRHMQFGCALGTAFRCVACTASRCTQLALLPAQHNSESTNHAGVCPSSHRHPTIRCAG
jgi:hypothetical protein